MLGEILRVLAIYSDCLVESSLGIGCDLKYSIEKFFRRLSIDSIPNIFGCKVILGEHFFRK